MGATRHSRLLLLPALLAAWLPAAAAEQGIVVPVPRSSQSEQIKRDSAASQRERSSNILSVVPVDRSATNPASEAATPPAPTAPAVAAPASPPAGRIAGKPSRPAPPPEPAPSMPDEQPLWDMLQAEQFDEVMAAIADLQSTHPDWQPPDELVRLARNGLLQQQVNDLIASEAYADLAALAVRRPELFDCAHIDWSWALAEAHVALGNMPQAEALLATLVPACAKEENRLATLYKARTWLDAAAWERLVDRETPASRTEKGETAFRQLQYEYAVERLLAESKIPDTAAVETRFEHLSGEILARRDGDAALIGAWNYSRLERHEKAARWFEQALQWDAERQDAKLGLALSRMKLGQHDSAYALAETLPATMPERASLMMEARLAQAQQAYEAKNYPAALAKLEQAAAIGPLPRYAELTRGWILFNQGEFELSADIFAALYREQAETQSAEGALLSLEKAGRHDALAALASSEPLAGMLRRHQAERAFQSKYWLAAKAEDPERYQQIGASALPHLTLFDGNRRKKGDRGTSQLRHETTGWEASAPVGDGNELRLRMEHISLDNGPEEVSGWQPTLIWLSETVDRQVRLQLGSTPSSAPVSATWTGEAELQLRQDWGNVGIEAYRRPVKESILSYTGSDTFGLVDRGRVTRNGIEVSGFRMLDDTWSLSGKASLEFINGVKVEDNNRFAIDGGISRNLHVPGFDYFTLGMNLGYEHYHRNLSQFGLGHGGYFSPDVYVHWGPAVNFMTEENRQFLLKGQAGFGGFYKREASTPLLLDVPDALRPLVPRIDRVKDTDVSYNADLQGVWRVNDHLQLGAALVKRYAPDYSDFSSFGFLRILFSPSKSVTSSDLPGSMSESVY